MNRPPAIFVAILVAGALPWAMSGLVPPSKDAAQAAYRQGQADRTLFWDANHNVAWSVPGMLGHQWTCSVHLDIVADPEFIRHGWYECSPWPWDGWFRGGRY